MEETYPTLPALPNDSQDAESMMWLVRALTVGKSKTNDGEKLIWNSLDTSFTNWTLDKLSIPASMSGLSCITSSSLAITLITNSISFFDVVTASNLGLPDSAATLPPPPPP